MVAGSADGMGAAVIDGVTGLRVDSNKVAAVNSALRRLLDDPALTQRMGAGRTGAGACRICL